MGERERFEAWWRATMNTKEMDFHRFAGDQYACHETNRSWMTWQEAARQEREAVAKLAEAYPCLSIDGAEVKSACRLIASAIRSRSTDHS